MRYYQRHRGQVSCACGRKWEAEYTVERGIPAPSHQQVSYCPGCLIERIEERCNVFSTITDWEELPSAPEQVATNMADIQRKYEQWKDREKRIGEIQEFTANPARVRRVRVRTPGSELLEGFEDDFGDFE